MELEESTFDVSKESEASIYDEWLWLYEYAYEWNRKWTCPISFFMIVMIARLFMHKNEMGSSDSIIRHFRFVMYVDFILTQLPNRRT